MLARTYEAEGKLPQAASLMEHTLGEANAGVDNGKAETLFGKEVLAHIYESQNEYSKAEALLREVEGVADRVFGLASPDGVIARQLLGRNLLHQGRCDQAAEYLRQANERWQAHPSSGWRPFEAQSLLGQALACQKQFSDAEPLLVSGYKGLKNSGSTMPVNQQFQVKDAGDRVAQLYAVWKKPSAQ